MSPQRRHDLSNTPASLQACLIRSIRLILFVGKGSHVSEALSFAQSERTCLKNGGGPSSPFTP